MELVPFPGKLKNDMAFDGASNACVDRIVGSRCSARIETISDVPAAHGVNLL